MNSPQPKSLRHDTAWAMTGALAQTTSQAAIMLVLAQTASMQVVGQYALGLAIAAPLNAFVDRALRLLQSTATDRDFPLGDYLAVRTVVGAAAVLITAIVAVAWRLSESAAQVVLLVALTRVVDGVAQTVYGRLHRGHQMKQIGQSQVMRGVLSAAVSLVFLIYWRRLDVALVMGLLANVLVVVVFDRRHVERLDACRKATGDGMLSTHIHFRRVQWSKMIGVALPLAMATWLVSVNINLPRLFLARSSSESTLGLFAILCYTSIPATMLVSAIMQAATPRLASLHRDGHLSQYRRLLRILALTTAAIGVANWCAVHTLGQPVLQRILGAEYAGWNRQLDWITAASSLGYVAVVPATAISAQRLFRLSLLTNAVSCVVAVLASATLIPRMSMMGAAITMLLTSGVHCLVSLAALRLAATFPTQFKFPRSTWPRGRRAA